MKAILITIRRKGEPAWRYIGLFRSTTDAVIHAIDLAGSHNNSSSGAPCSISAVVQEQA